MGALPNTSIALLRSLRFREDAKRTFCSIPLGSIYWEDELPELKDLLRLPEHERDLIWRLFAIRLKVWDGEQLSVEDQSFWESVRSEAPEWALFARLFLLPGDREAREQLEGDIANELTAFFERADQIELTDKGNGLQQWSATFNLTDKVAAPKEWWRFWR